MCVCVVPIALAKEREREKKKQCQKYIFEIVCRRRQRDDQRAEAEGGRRRKRRRGGEEEEDDDGMVRIREVRDNDNDNENGDDDKRGRQVQEVVGGRRHLSGAAPPAGGAGGRSLLLCCVCQEQSNTYRYEVVYNGSRSAGVTASTNGHALGGSGHAHHSPVLAASFFSRPGPAPICYSSEDSVIRGGGNANSANSANAIANASSDEGCYYNFPPRPPRHGHLKWAVPPSFSPFLFPDLELGELEEEEEDHHHHPPATYPDYPVHIRTTTLRRVVVSSLNRKKKEEEEGRVLERREIEVAGGQGGIILKIVNCPDSQIIFNFVGAQMHFFFLLPLFVGRASLQLFFYFLSIQEEEEKR